MEEYFFLFGLAGVWILFAMIQDLRFREVSNWLNFSLLGFALAYRLFYSIFSGEYWFFVWGVLGFGVCFCLAMVFYYSRAFAGGDAKLLMSLGAVLPISSLRELVVLPLVFVFLLFFLGMVWSLVYSLVIVHKRRKLFEKEFGLFFGRSYWWFFFALLSVIFVGISFPLSWLKVILMLFMLVLPFLFVYLKALEGCLIRRVSYGKLTVGDWLFADVRVGRKVIEKSVHGLSVRDILLLRKARKSVLIREGIPFVPAFLFAFSVMVCVWVTGWLSMLFSLLG
ncbi:MAG TPA: A24 family peptidase [Candidatus Nanoarchaeia archaeon]|nr:A24 family peptidase [Candidatus Nanoarchaeia archaeon]